MISIKDQIVQLEQDLAKQEAAKLRLAKQLEAAKAAAAPRSAYTKQIIEILNNVSKQKKETEAVIEDIKSTQKDINLLEGKLQRTYMDADYLLFEVYFSCTISQIFSTQNIFLASEKGP